MARRNRRISDTQYMARRVRRADTRAVRYLAADLRPVTALIVGGAR